MNSVQLFVGHQSLDFVDPALSPCAAVYGVSTFAYLAVLRGFHIKALIKIDCRTAFFQPHSVPRSAPHDQINRAGA